MRGYIEKVRLILSCIGARIFMPNIGNSPDPRVFVVVHTAKLGDMVCATPVFRAIKQRYPHARVIVVGNAPNHELLAGSGDVDDYLVFDKSRIRQLARRLMTLRADFGCVLSPNFHGLALLLLGGVRVVAAPVVTGGYCPYQTAAYRLLRRFAIPVEHRMRQYAPREYLRLLEPAGIHATDTRKHIPVDAAARTRVQRLLAERGVVPNERLIGIAPGVGHRIKLWPPERFAAIANHITGRYRSKVVIVGGPNDRCEVSEMLSGIRDRDMVILPGELPITDLKALIGELQLFISTDSGPVYIAEALNVPVIDIIGPVDEREQPPRGDGNVSIWLRDRKRPEIHIMNSRAFDEGEARRQILGITLEMVLPAVDSVLQR